jgi:gluconolactonase
VGAATPNAGAAGTGAGVGGSAGSGGAAGTGASSTAGTSAGGTGSSSEGNPNPGGLEGEAGSSDGSSSGDGESEPAPAGDAGAPPVAGQRCPAGPFADSPFPGGAAPQPQMLCGGMTFTEGAVWFAERNTLFFSDFNIGNPLAGRIMAFTPGGQCTEFITNGGTNGLVIGPDGNLLGARHADQTITRFDLETQEPTVVVANNGGLAFNSPNDIAVRSDGNFYFTDPGFLLGNRMSQQPQATYRVDPSGALTIIDTTASPNGISLSPDESRLYLATFGGGGNIVVFDVAADGSVGQAQTFVAGVGSDGMAVDCAGNLYTTGGPGVQIFSPEGDPIGTINAQGAANLAFGGPNRQTLFITATTQLLGVELAIPGLPY